MSRKGEIEGEIERETETEKEKETGEKERKRRRKRKRERNRNRKRERVRATGKCPIQKRVKARNHKREDEEKEEKWKRRTLARGMPEWRRTVGITRALYGLPGSHLLRPGVNSHSTRNCEDWHVKRGKKKEIE